MFTVAWNIVSSFDLRARIEFDDFKFCLSAPYKSSYEFICKYLIHFCAKPVIFFAIIKSRSKSSILLSFSLLSILKEKVRDSIWASIRPNSSSVVWEGDWARTGECTLDIWAVANGRFIENDESIWYKVPF